MHDDGDIAPPPSAKLRSLALCIKETPPGEGSSWCPPPTDRSIAMDQLLVLLLLAAASCVNFAIADAPWPPAALAAYSLWILASAALAVLLPRRRPE
ncbi:unnamed protein product [Urochloa humidicola]